MIARARLLVAVVRPPVLILLTLFTAIGVAQGGRSESWFWLAKPLVVVVAFLVCAVIVNDLADEAIDRVNLPADWRRPLVAGTAHRRQMTLAAAAAAAMAVAGSALVHRPAMVVVAAGLVMVAGYSLRPVRLADRGAVASLVLPAGYVAVPYLVGIESVRGTLHANDLILLGGLYVGFIGRILLKDFRDVRGDELFGKRTFLVRHGRRWTCAASAVCWTAGTATLGAVRGFTWGLIVANAVYLALALWLLARLSTERGTRSDENTISAIAITGRGMLVTVLAHFSMAGAHWAPPAYSAVLAALVTLTLGQAATMLRHGPTSGLLTVPGMKTQEGKTPATVGKSRPERSTRNI